MNLTKKQINDIKVEERKKSREKQKASDFMKRSLSIYNGQKKRAEEKGTVLPFTIEQFREWLKLFVDQMCTCDKVKMTIKGLAVDHAQPLSRGGGFEIANLTVMCKHCNFRKGSLLKSEFAELQEFVKQRLHPDAQADLWRRLTLGGKWTFAGK